MNPRLLIDAIVQQTTVLIAQLSTAAGIRSPLAHVADRVFLSLAQEIERQGVSRKVAADMFGLALRSYQRKVQRLEESGGALGHTLWESVLDYVSRHGPIGRDAVLSRFNGDDELAVVSVLGDLVDSGLVFGTGRGNASVYRATTEADRRAISSKEVTQALSFLLWGTVFRSPGTSTRGLIASTAAREDEIRDALALLLVDGRVTRTRDDDDAPLEAAPFVIAHDATQGWEAAVFDHYQALANAVAAKLRFRATQWSHKDYVGGTTLHFGIRPGHPHEVRVLGMLQRVREELNVLWNDVLEENRTHPFPEDEATRVTFYFGQNVMPPEEENGSGNDRDGEKRR